MQYFDFKGLKISKLGFGCMRLPEIEGKIDTILFDQMVDKAMDNGVNYFDTAYQYHEGESEIAVGKALKRYPRESFYLADKFPGYLDLTNIKPKDIFEEQLEKCQVDYFDFYLMHCVTEKNIANYKNADLGIMDYFIEQKRIGRIKHLGFSSHGLLPNLKEFLDLYGKDLEFCQIQLNYLDYSLQDAKTKLEIIKSYGLKVWVMEPVRGGKLASFNEEITTKLNKLHSGSIASFAFRYLFDLDDNIGVILSGMSDMNQVADNINTFNIYEKLSEKEKDYLYEIAEILKEGVPCTKCKYCVEGCPQKLNIPMLLQRYNEIKYLAKNKDSIEDLSNEQLPNNCIKCGQCVSVCPQKIDIITTLEKLNDLLH